MNSQRQAKEALYTAVAQVVQAAANAHRLELLDLLVQAPRAVEQLAKASAMSLANTIPASPALEARRASD